MRSYPGTLLDESCRLAVRRQRDYGRERGVPWGISESAYDVRDHRGTYQYRAFGVPGLGLKRGLADDLVVAPYASALAALVHPTAAAANLRRLVDLGLLGAYGCFEAIDYTPRRAGEAPEPIGRAAPAVAGGVVVRAWFAHHQGMTPGGAGRRADRPADGGALPLGPPGAGHRAAAPGARRRARPPPSGRGPTRRRASPRRCRPRRSAASARRTPPSRTPSSSPTAATPRWSPTPAAAPASAAGRAVTRWRQDATRDPGRPAPLPARRAERARLVGHPPPDRRGGARTTLVTFTMEKATFQREDDGLGHPARRGRLARRTTSRCGASR